MRNQYLTFIIILVVGCGYKNTSPVNPEICSIFDKQLYDSISERSILISPNQFKKGYFILSNGVRYSVIENENKVINFISTNDTTFYINNINIGMKYNQINKKDILDEKYVSGWGYIINLKSGWNALFADDTVFRNHSIHEHAPISAFYIDSNCD